MRPEPLLLLGSLLVLSGCHTEAVWNTTTYAVAVNDWQGDFLRAPARFDDYLLEGRLLYHLSTSAPAGCCDPSLRLFRLSDGNEVPGSIQPGRTLDGRELPEGYASFVANETLADGWYIAFFDARPYRAFGPIEPFRSAPALGGVAYARFRLGDQVDWVRTSAILRDESGTVEIAVLLSSSVPLSELASSQVVVRSEGSVIDCTPASAGEDPVPVIAVSCTGLRQGDSIEVSLTSPRVGHPLGAMRPHELVIDRDRTIHVVAPDLGLDLLRATYGVGDGL